MNESNVAQKEPVNLNRATSITADEVDQVMAYHPWTPEKVNAGNKVRNILGEALQIIIEVVPPSPDRSTAIRKLREARMDCNSAITHSGAF